MVLVASGLLAACGPIRSTSVLVNAASDVAAAKTAGAEEGAPYELSAAEAYLNKAREEQGHADFEVAITLAKRSSACARAALARVNGERAPDDPTSEPQPDVSCTPTRRVVGGRPKLDASAGPEPADPIPEPEPESKSNRDGEVPKTEAPPEADS